LCRLGQAQGYSPQVFPGCLPARSFPANDAGTVPRLPEGGSCDYGGWRYLKSGAGIHVCLIGTGLPALVNLPFYGSSAGLGGGIGLPHRGSLSFLLCPFPVPEGVIVISFCSPYQQQLPHQCRLPVAEAVEIDAAGQGDAGIVVAVPGEGVETGVHFFGLVGIHFPPD